MYQIPKGAEARESGLGSDGSPRDQKRMKYEDFIEERTQSCKLRNYEERNRVINTKAKQVSQAQSRSRAGWR